MNRAFESGLSDGVMFERRLFHALFATQDQKEGMDAFVNKRPAVFVNKPRFSIRPDAVDKTTQLVRLR